MQPKIIIILVNWNGFSDTKECLLSIEKIKYTNFETLLVDNGSTDDSVFLLKKTFPTLTIIETKKNLGFAGGNNVGIKLALDKKADFIVLLNNDTIVDPYFLEAFYQASKNNPQAGILGANILRYDNKTTIDHLGGLWNHQKGEFTSIGQGKNINDPTYQTLQVADYVCGCCFFIKREVIEKIGLLEEKFFLIWEESDYCFLAKRSGFEILAVSQAKVWHKISSSFTGKVHTHYYWWRNRLFFISRNFTINEKILLYFGVIGKEIFHECNLFFLKSLQFFLLKIFSPKKLSEKRKIRLLQYKAGFYGIIDYFFQKFGQGPSWLTDRKK